MMKYFIVCMLWIILIYVVIMVGFSTYFKRLGMEAERKAILKADSVERKLIKKELAEELYKEAHRRAIEKYSIK